MTNSHGFLTSGDLARLLGRPVKQVQHVLNSRPIPDSGRAGIIKLYSPDVIPALRRALREIDGRRNPRRSPAVMA